TDASPRDSNASTRSPSRCVVPCAVTSGVGSCKGHEHIAQSLQGLGPCLRSCRQRRHITEHKDGAPHSHKLVGDRCFVAVAMQEGDTVCVGRPAPIEGGMTDVRITEIDQADKIESLWLDKRTHPGCGSQERAYYHRKAPEASSRGIAGSFRAAATHPSFA